jgi:hypothetical protein
MTPEEAAAAIWLYREALMDRNWKMRTCLFPRRCRISDRWMWGSRHWSLVTYLGNGLDGFFTTTIWMHREVATEMWLKLDT